MLCVRPIRTPSQELPLPGKRHRGAWQGQQASLSAISPQDTDVVMVAAVKSKAAVIMGELGGVKVETMLDSGSSVSLVQRGVLRQAKGIEKVEETKPLRLVTASSDDLPIMDHIRAPVKLCELELVQEFVVVESLVIDFLHDNALVLDFTATPVRVCNYQTPQIETSDTVVLAEVLPMYQRARKEQARACAIASIEEQGTDVIDECAIPMYQEATSVKFPECPKSSLMRVVCKYQSLFRTMPGVTNAAHHFIPTTGHPIRVPPRRIPAHYREEVER